MNRNCSPSAIGGRIADLRREVGITQGELVEKADISVDFITLKRENFYEVLNQKMIERNF